MSSTRDATDSWAGYLYQSVLGIVVTLEKILQLQESGQKICGHFVYEDVEDFSIYVRDEESITSSSTYQAKYKKGTTPSIYYPFISALSQSQAANTTNMQFYLNISSNVNFLENPNTVINQLPENYTSFVYKYRNGNKHLGGCECLTYLEKLISDYREIANVDISAGAIERVSCTLLAFINSVIIDTKEQRLKNPNYRREITFKEIITFLKDTTTTLSNSIIANTLRKRFLRAYMLCNETSDEQSAQKLEELCKEILVLTPEEFISFVKKCIFIKI